MRRRLGMICMLLAAVLAAVVLTGASRGKEPVQARIVKVRRGDVVVTSALSGRVAYEEECPAVSAIPGRVAEVYVAPGQRVTQGQALLRLDSTGAERAAAAFAAGSPDTVLAEHIQALLGETVIRATEDAVVRQILVGENTVVGPGEAVAVLSGSGQLIRCIAVEKDARELQTGMVAAILSDGEEIGRARVESVGNVSADPATGRIVCEVMLAPQEPLPVPHGALVDADVILEERRNVPVLPLEAVTARGTLWWVHDGICTEIPAEIVLSDEMSAMVPLAEGTAVAVGEFSEGQCIREEEQ